MRLLATVSAMALTVVGCAAIPLSQAKPPSALPQIEILDIQPVWSGHPVGFCLLTHKGRQFAAYYDANRQMTVASRRLNEKTWRFTKLPSFVRWDSHNYVTMVMDSEDYLHVTGNMHVVPLLYFRSRKPLDASSLERVAVMVEKKTERRVTYPHFLRGPAGELIFRYRDGSSGSGDDYYNTYHPQTQTWHRLVDGPLLSGKGDHMNGYFTLPTRGPDGCYHMIGVWRDGAGAEQNHDISYARSRDLVHWETAAGKPLRLPLTVKNIDIVDPVPVRGGVINGGPRLGFDSRNRPVISYHKYDPQGNSQVYCARPWRGGWKVVQISDWQGYRWKFRGVGSLPGPWFEVNSVSIHSKGRLALRCVRHDGKSGAWELDEETLQPIGPLPAPTPEATRKMLETAAFYQDLEKGFSDWKQPGLRQTSAFDQGSSGEPGVTYSLKWATLGPNRDRPRQAPPPIPTMLRLYKAGRPPVIPAASSG